MRYMLMFILLFCVSVSANPNQISTVYFKKSKIVFTKASSAANHDSLSYYNDKNNKQETFKHDSLINGFMLVANLFNNKLVTIFDIGSGVHQIMIFDEKKGILKDSFWGSHSSVSPNGQFIVFRPYHSRGTLISHSNKWPVGETRVYDLTKTPIQNRTLVGQKEFERSSISKGSIGENAGIPIYPLGDYNEPGFAFTDIRENSVGAVEVFWYNEQSFIFHTPSFNNKTTLVDASFSAKTGKFIVKDKTITSKDLSVHNPPDTPSLSIKKIEKFGDTIKLYLPFSMVYMESF